MAVVIQTFAATIECYLSVTEVDVLSKANKKNHNDLQCILPMTDLSLSTAAPHSPNLYSDKRLWFLKCFYKNIMFKVGLDVNEL